MCFWSDRSPIYIQIDTQNGNLGEGDSDFCFQGDREYRPTEVEQSTVMFHKVNSWSLWWKKNGKFPDDLVRMTV